MAPSLDAFPPVELSQDYFGSGVRAKYNAEVTRLMTKISQPIKRAANISYHPNLSSYVAEAPIDSGIKVPAGWPRNITGPMAWIPSDFRSESDWVFSLSDGHKEEIARALKHFKSMKAFCHPIHSTKIQSSRRMLRLT